MSTRPVRENIMLANPLTQRKLASLGDIVLAQRKLRGERCRVQWYNDEPVLITSYGNEFRFLTKIKEALIKHSKDFSIQIPFDGEIYRHGWSQEQINSAANRGVNYNPDCEDLEYHIFDIQDPFADQVSRLSALSVAAGYFNGPLHIVQTQRIQSIDWMDFLVQYVEEGYEGIILRDMTSKYIGLGGDAKRSNGMLKYKPHEKDKYLIIALKEGTGWCEGMLGSFEVQGRDGTVFSVGTGPELTKDKRIKYWQIRDQIIGKYLTVKHEPIRTVGGIPVCTVAYQLKGL